MPKTPKTLNTRPKYRALELYHKDTPFKPKVIPDKRDKQTLSDGWTAMLVGCHITTAFVHTTKTDTWGLRPIGSVASFKNWFSAGSSPAAPTILNSEKQMILYVIAYILIGIVLHVIYQSSQGGRPLDREEAIVCNLMWPLVLVTMIYFWSVYLWKRFFS